MSDERIDDIATALIRLTAAFKKHGMTPPTSISVDRETAQVLRSSLGVQIVFDQHSYGPHIEIAGYRFVEPTRD